MIDRRVLSETGLPRNAETRSVNSANVYDGCDLAPTRDSITVRQSITEDFPRRPGTTLGGFRIISKMLSLYFNSRISTLSPLRPLDAANRRWILERSVEEQLDTAVNTHFALCTFRLTVNPKRSIS